ncbi:unnamed protein product (macronuclear) [Paramecium tetraurelia]|uniref:Uncharacterized protein n=1 Tax=Paramecium tetraurelia TaxID=5888 RepID=A0CK18_PARTE|nr:uncharacterized protein GSPATT00000847001 [Paramecium tetraurelia]CAK71135.1 unnamed protein product [Paramecium tetraurelia]|eukprot:XP_001438532.1 hypothetical protein (macronuclear) [Paramecium tetraurelia strain d4-2]
MSQASFTGFITIEDIKKPKYDVNHLLDPNYDSFVRDILPIKIQNFEIRRLEWDDFTGEPNKESPWIAHSYWNIHYEIPKREISRASSNQKQSPTVTNQKNSNANITQQSEKINLSPKNQIQITQQSQEKVNVKQQSPKLPPKIPLQQNNIQNRTNSRLQKQVHTPSLRIASIQGVQRQSQQKNQTPKKSSRSNSNSTLMKQQSPRQQLNVLVCCKLLEKSWTKSDQYDDLLEHETGHYLIGCLCALEFKRKAEQMELSNSENQTQEIKQLFQANFRTFLSIEKDYDKETNHYCNWRMQMKWNRKIKEQLLLYEMYFNN